MFSGLGCIQTSFLAAVVHAATTCLANTTSVALWSWQNSRSFWLLRPARTQASKPAFAAQQQQQKPCRSSLMVLSHQMTALQTGRLLHSCVLTTSTQRTAAHATTSCGAWQQTSRLGQRQHCRPHSLSTALAAGAPQACAAGSAVTQTVAAVSVMMTTPPLLHPQGVAGCMTLYSPHQLWTSTTPPVTAGQQAMRRSLPQSTCSCRMRVRVH